MSEQGSCRGGAWALGLGLVLAGGSARAGEDALLDGNTELQLELSTGEEVVGWHYQVKDGVWVLSGGNRFTSVPLTLVQEARVDGRPVALGSIHADLARQQLELSLSRAAPPALPAPGAVAALSFAWGGAGHAALGDTKRAIGYALFDLALVGGGGAYAVSQEQIGVLFPLAGLVLLSRGVAAGDAARRARARRRQHEVGPPALPEGP